MDIETIITTASISMAILVYILGSIERRGFEKRQNTVRLISRFHEAGPVQDALAMATHWKKTGRQFADDNVSAEDDKTIIALLDYYAFIASLTLRGDIDRRSVLDMVAGAMFADYGMLSGYIAARRKALNRPRLYSDLETFVDRYKNSALVR